MRDHRPKLTQDVISETGLKQFTEHVSDILAINQTLQSILPASMVAHCRAANVRQSQLLIEVANASIQIKLNYERIRILSELRAAGFSRLVGLEFKVNPELYRGESLQEKKKDYHQGLSEQAAQSILMVADMAPPKLQQRMKSLAKLAEKNKRD
ncbi:DUF721 domain-containing protein [Vibrio gangliei]|uniref:DUF721 domain-containing protein n=1 Tax=Vibrio gangliei TaxID=2077090 RepID=UPI000D015956|nr:DciA family protein [Vibrio gangliei]